jgi:hypothetical protein
MAKEEEVKEEDLPLTADDVDPKEEADDLLEPEPKSAPEPKKESEAPSKADVERAARLLDAAAKAPASETAAVHPLTAFDYGMMMVSEFREITDPTSTFFKVAVEKKRELLAQGHPDPDIDYLAAKAAAADPRVTLEKNVERVRETARDASASFPRPTRRAPEPAEPELTEKQEAHAKLAGITDPAVKKMLAENLRAASRELRR